METVLFVIFCLVIALFGAWDVCKLKHHKSGKLPEDIQ